MTPCSLVCDIGISKVHTASIFRDQISHVGKVAGYAEGGKQVTQKSSIRTMNAKKEEGWLLGNNDNSML
jgi:hypothetical protein